MELFNRLNANRHLCYRLNLRFNGADWFASVVEVDGVFEPVCVLAAGFGYSLEEACEKALSNHAQMEAHERLSMEDAEKLVAVVNRITQESSLTPQQP